MKVIRCKKFSLLLASNKKFFMVKFFTVVSPVQAGYFTSFSWTSSHYTLK